MKTKIIFFYGLIILGILFPTGCKNGSPKQSTIVSHLRHQLTILKNDSIYVLLKNGNDYPFSGKIAQAGLSEDERIVVDSLLLTAIKDYNRTIPKKIEKMKNNISNLDRNNLLLKASSYNYQIVSVIDETGKKLVWINAMCEPPGYWRNEIAIILDGGNCFFNLKIDLNRKEYFEFMVNGVA